MSARPAHARRSHAPDSRAWRSVTVKLLLFVGGFVLAGAGTALAYYVVNVVYAPGSDATATAARLAAPTGATATEAGTTSVVLRWNDPPSQLSGAAYEVTATPGGQTCSTEGSSCSVRGLAAGTTYHFAVAAVLDNWRSAPSTADSTTLGVTTASLPDGTYERGYSTRLVAIGGSGHLRWSVTAGTLPPWAELDPDTGEIRGIPVTTGATSGLQFSATDTNGFTATSTTLTLTVNPSDQAVTFTTAAPSNAAIGGPTYTPAGSSTAGLPVTIGVDPSSKDVCAMSGGSVSFWGVGTCELDAVQSGNSDWNPAAQVQQSFEVGRSDQRITFTSEAPSAATVDGIGYTVTATGGASGNPVTFSIDGTSTSGCSVAGSTLTFSAPAGSCIVDADQVGDASHNPAPTAQQAFTVLAAPTPSTGNASSVATTTATLNGSVNAHGDTDTARFCYSTTRSQVTSCGPGSTMIDAGTHPAGTSPTDESVGLSGLSPNTTYSFNLEATSSSGADYYGTPGSFRTSQTPTFSAVDIGNTADSPCASGVTAARSCAGPRLTTTSGRVNLILVRIETSLGAPAIGSISGPFGSATQLATQTYASGTDELSAWQATGNGSSGVVKLHFSNTTSVRAASVEVVELGSGDSAVRSTTASGSDPARPSLDSSINPRSGSDGEVVFVGASGPTSFRAPSGWTDLANAPAGWDSFSNPTIQPVQSFSVTDTVQSWGAIALEIGR